MEAQYQIITVMVAYMILLVLWGLYQGRKVKSESDYAIGGRNLPGWAAALSERASGESSWALLGLPGAAYATGILEIWTAIGCVLGIITAWILIAWRLRDEAEKYKVNTFTEYISKKHGDTGVWLRAVASFTIVFFFFFYVGAQFMGGGKTMNTLFNIPIEYGMLILAAMIIPYTVYGGFFSVVYTDVIQSFLMIFTLIVGPVVGFVYLSHHPELFAQSIPQALERAGSGYTSLTGAFSGFTAGVALAAGLSWFFGYLGGQPQLSMRFMAIRDSKQAKKARNIGILWTIFAYAGALSLGWIGLAIFGPSTLKDQEFVMPMVILKLFPPALAAILITGAVAAMISTADSLLILSSTELSENLIKPALRKGKDISKRQSLIQSRVITTLLAFIALLLAYLTPQKLIFSIVGYVWAGIGSTFSVVILLSLFWKKYHGKAVILTIVSGLLFTIVWFNSGMEYHYKVSENTLQKLYSQNIPAETIQQLQGIKNVKFVSSSKLDRKLAEILSLEEYNNYSGLIVKSAKVQGISARLLTFFVALLVAFLSTVLIRAPKIQSEATNNLMT